MFRMKLKRRTNNGRRGRGGKGPWAKQTPPIFHPPWGIHRWLVHLVLACPVLLGSGLVLGSCERRGSVFRVKLDEYKLDIPDNKHEFLCVILDPTSEFNSNDEL